MSYELKTEKFSGPLEKLLELIEAKQLQINEISLAEVTDDFLQYLRSLTDAESFSAGPREVRVGLRIVADFIAVASRLVLIKSKSLLPDLTFTGEEEAGIKDLEMRLKIYQELKPALKMLDVLWKKSGREFNRPYFLEQGASLAGSAKVFYPGEGLKTEVLFGALQKVFESFVNLELETRTIKEEIITLEEKIEEIVGRMEKLAETKFSSLSGSKSRAEIIVIFLAILHLAREQLISLEQKSRFSDIVIKKANR
jgi:segregation and condensation protein A